MLRAIKVIHTAVWTFFVLAIGAIWVFALRADYVSAAWAIAVVMIEVAILGLNHGQCPLGRFVARHTEDRAANFDIHLPAWLARRTNRFSELWLRLALCSRSPSARWPPR